LWLLMVALVVGLGALLTWKFWKPGGRGRAFAIRAYSKYHSAILVSVCLLMYCMLNFVILYSRIPLINPWGYDEKKYSTVISLQLKNDKSPVRQSGVRLIRTSDE